MVSQSFQRGEDKMEFVERESDSVESRIADLDLLGVPGLLDGLRSVLKQRGLLHGDGETLSFLHAGGNMGYRAFMIMYVASGDGAVFMTNSDQGMEVGREMLRAASSVYDWPDYRSTMQRRVILERAALAPLGGTYDFGGGVQVVIAPQDSGDQISITFPNGDTYGLVATGPLSFVDPETGVTVDFEGTGDLRKVIVYGEAGVRVRD